MASFTTRVELRGTPSKADYDKLHAAMRARGFTQTVVAPNGKSFYLPHAEYDLNGNLTVDQVLEMARAAANATWPSHLVLVTKVSERTWFLVPVD